MSASGKKNYWQRKKEAFQNYGKAQSRPQQNFREFLLERRKLNLGLRTPTPKPTNEIDGHILPLTDLAVTALPLPSPFVSPCFEIVDSDEAFDLMLDDLGEATEVIVDAEFNRDHSYHGMICWIQLLTNGKCFLVDPFPTYKKICRNLNHFFRDANNLKVLFGCANDVIGMHRDFDSVLIGAIDIQLLHQEMMRKLYNAFANENNSVVYDIFDIQRILEKMTGLQRGQAVTRDQLVGIKKRTTDLISLEHLADIYFPKLGKPADATFADWRIRPLQNQEMIQYAIYDVLVLDGIWQQMKTLIRLPIFDGCLDAAIQATKELLKKPFEVAVVSSPSFQLPEKEMELANYLLEFRSLHAKIIDEPESEILTTREVIDVVKSKPKSDSELMKIFKKSRRDLPESYESWNKAILRIVNEGREFFETLMTPGKCHVCKGRHTYPHLAFGCVEMYSARAVAEFMNSPENHHFREREYQRRLSNWRAKGHEGPCPYLKPPRP